MTIAIVIAGIAVLVAMWRSSNDIADAIGPLDELMEADTSNGHYLLTLGLFVVGIVILLGVL